MKKNRKIFNLIIIIVLAFLCFNFIYPNGINKGIDFIKPKLSNVPVLRRISRLPEKGFRLGLDLQGGSHLVYEADLSGVEGGAKNEAMQGLRDVIERRVNLFGVGEPQVAIQEVKESQRLVVELPGIKDISQAIKMIGETPYLEFREERDEEERDALLKELEQFQAEIEAMATGTPAEVIEAKIRDFSNIYKDPYFKETALTGQYLSGASLNFDQTTMEPQVLLEFDEEGKELFREITTRNIGKQVAIIIDGVTISAPVVREAIVGGTAQITGDFTIEEAKELVRNLNAGALPVPIELISQTSVGPMLGRISLEKSLFAGVFGLLMICLFMIVFYRLSGLLAALSLLVYAMILLSLFKLMSVTLTLAGIGGAVLSIGMAVDANVLIFERIKEEKRGGASFQSAVRIGFARAWTSIRDSNFTTLLVAFIMFSFGSGFVKGFALTLSLGIFVSIFSAMFVTKSFLRLFEGTKLENIKWLWG